MSLSQAQAPVPEEPRGSKNEARTSGGSKNPEETRKTVGSVMDRRLSLGSNSTRISQFSQIRKPSQLKSFQKDLPPCQIYRTRSSLDHIKNPVDQPKRPIKYNAPFRRNYRYFGYPQELNLGIDTPPRVKSWGSIPEIPPKLNKHKRRAPFSSYAFDNNQERFDPHWMGRLLKSNLLLDNPGLIPATDKARISLGSTNKLKLIHPDFEVGNCPSDLYFPITEKSRKAFCKINKTVQEKLDQQVHAYTVQNPTVMKFVAMEQVMLKHEEQRKSKEAATMGRRSHQPRMSAFSQSIADTIATSEEKLVYEYSNQPLSPVIKTMCVESNYPGMNRQVYERPRDDDISKDVKTGTDDDVLIYGIPRIPEFAMNIPEDVWLKLAKVRARQQQMEKNLKARVEMQDPDEGKFRTFTQPELRDEVLKRAREDFLEKLKEDLDAPLPPELFQDNRGHHQPYHDFYDKGELPAQGPFWWKTPREDRASEEELKIVDKFIRGAKEHHYFTHHLPGLLYSSRHPYEPFELDWMEKGTEMGVVRDARKTPSQLHDMPAYMMFLDKDRFQEKFNQVVKEGAKDLVGPEVYGLYKRTYGIRDEIPVEDKHSAEEMPDRVVHVRRVRRKKKASSVSKPKDEVEEDEDAEEGEEGEEEDDEEEEHDEEEEEEDDEKVLVPPVEIEPEYKLSQDLLEEEIFPLPDVRFSSIEFPKGFIPDGVKDKIKLFKHYVESADPVRVDEEEAKSLADSDTTTDSEDTRDELIPKSSHRGTDTVSHLQVMYQDAVKKRHKSFHRPPKGDEMEPPRLKDVFLMETYTEDIDNLLTHGDNIPKFLQLF